MRELHKVGDNLYEIRTLRVDLTNRICHYGEVHGFWKVKSNLLSEEGVFSVKVELLNFDVEYICRHLDLKLI